jgi:aminopeptidase N
MNIFDTISYAKGSVICRMMADFTGPKFKQILRAYMKRFQFKNATTADLIGICDEICGSETIIKPSEYLMPWIT